MLVQNSLRYLVLYFAGIRFSANKAHAIATSCQVYPSEYAYKVDSVTEQESYHANCRRYPQSGLQVGVYTELYIHCDGTQLKLIDSHLGQEQYQISDYYVWLAGSNKQLLFMFPTRVSLTTITLHYYSDSVQGLPRLTFYAVPDNFDVWDIPTTSDPRVDVAIVPAGGEPAGRRNVSINVNFNIKKVMMYKFSSTFAFSVSEVEFFTLHCENAITPTSTKTDFPSLSAQSEVDNRATYTETLTTEKLTYPTMTLIPNFAATNSSSMSMSTITSSVTDSTTSELALQSNRNIITIGVSIAMLLILSTTLIVTVVIVIWSYKRRSTKQKMTDSTYSTLNRRTGQLQSIQCDSSELYDQIHLSPSTGQTEFIPKPQSENVNNPLCNSHPTHPEIEYSVINSNEATQTQATYAVIDKNKKKKEVSSTSADKGAHAGGKDDPTKRRQKSLSDMYASDHKDRKKMNSKQESNPPPPVEELYAAVKNKPAGSSVSVNEPVSQTAEDLYTAVMKKPKESSVNDEVVPSIPPHTTEKLYTAVQKKPKGNTMENEEKAPPIPPHTVEDTY